MTRRRTITGILALRGRQAEWRRIADDPSIRSTAREAAQRQVDSLEREIRAATRPGASA